MDDYSSTYYFWYYYSLGKFHNNNQLISIQLTFVLYTHRGSHDIVVNNIVSRCSMHVFIAVEVSDCDFTPTIDFSLMQSSVIDGIRKNIFFRENRSEAFLIHRISPSYTILYCYS
jgi:hypothetical protein